MKEIYTPKLALYHPNGKGTGSAILIELHPAHGMNAGALFFRISNQKTVGSCHTPPTFDWTYSTTVRMDFVDLSKMLQVFRGETESIEGDRGIYHRSAKITQVIRFDHKVEPYGHYALRVATKGIEEGDEERIYSFNFTPAEALGLCEAIAGSMPVIAFGTGFEQTSIELAMDEERDKQAPAPSETKKE